MKYYQLNICLTLSLLLSAFAAQAQFKTQIKMPKDRNASGKVVDVPKIDKATYLSMKKQAYIFLQGGGNTAYAFNPGNGKFRQLNGFNNASSVKIFLANSGLNGVFTYKKNRTNYCYNPANGRVFALAQPASVFDGVHLLSVKYLKTGGKPNFENGLLSYIDVNKGPKESNLLLHSALNKAVNSSPKYKSANTIIKANMVGQIIRAGNGFMISFLHGKAGDKVYTRSLIAWMKINKTGNRLQIAQTKIIAKIGSIFSTSMLHYRGKTYVTESRKNKIFGTYVFDRNGNQIGFHSKKRFVDLAREKKVPTAGKYVSLPGGKIIYNLTQNRVETGQQYQINGQAYLFNVRERSYPQGQQSKLKPYWFLRADKK
ncbi:MAG TPA: hypothetical protein DCS93_09030 [Microscillaceae bacterium]|nr:hypothetical protein [Microscillaceae bacterium]